ncbi:MAG: putative DNA-binding domain-containing protein [Gammaproteobacteria bacterium]|nr:putative DNA-binding domain-containing protein [Gammaproteobacteria bacterium]
MTTLARVQREFQDHLLRGDSAVLRRVIGTPAVPVATRLGIYARAYRSRLVEALESNYPVLAKLLGEPDFEVLAVEYITAHDSPFYSIRYYGDQLAKFLSAREDYAAAPVLAELAQWEWSMTSVFDAADEAPLAPEALSGIAPARWAQLRFRWHPSVQRLTLWWNVPQLWQALGADGERPEMVLAAAPLDWLLWREGLTSYYRSLSKTEASALDAARSGWPFGELCTLLCEELGDSEAPAQAAALLRGWITAGLIVGTG